MIGFVPILLLGVWTIIRFRQLTPYVSNDPAERCSLLRISDSKGRTVGASTTYRDSIPYLLEMAKYDPDTIAKAIDRVGEDVNDDLRQYLEPIYWDGIVLALGVDPSKRTIFERYKMPMFRSGYWLTFKDSWARVSKSGVRRNLEGFEAWGMKPEEIDAELVRSFQHIPFWDGRCRFDEPILRHDFMSRLKRLVGL